LHKTCQLDPIQRHPARPDLHSRRIRHVRKTRQPTQINATISHGRPPLRFRTLLLNTNILNQSEGRPSHSFCYFLHSLRILCPRPLCTSVSSVVNPSRFSFPNSCGNVATLYVTMHLSPVAWVATGDVNPGARIVLSAAPAQAWWSRTRAYVPG